MKKWILCLVFILSILVSLGCENNEESVNIINDANLNININEAENNSSLIEVPDTEDETWVVIDEVEYNPFKTYNNLKEVREYSISEDLEEVRFLVESICEYPGVEEVSESIFLNLKDVDSLTIALVDSSEDEYINVSYVVEADKNNTKETNDTFFNRIEENTASINTDNEGTGNYYLIFTQKFVSDYKIEWQTNYVKLPKADVNFSSESFVSLALDSLSLENSNMDLWGACFKEVRTSDDPVKDQGYVIKLSISTEM